jgi:pimeloyl-ACP methyl ester carboxylesterase
MFYALQEKFMIPVHHFGGSGPTLHFAPANGFGPATYTPLLNRFTAQYHVLSVLPRAFWGGEPPNELRSWKEELAADLLQGLGEQQMTQVIAVGHSFGAIASLLAAIVEPQRFKSLILLDPTIFAPQLAQLLKQTQVDGTVEQIPLVTRALKRQRDFENADTAFAYFRDKTLFRDWPEEMLWAYIDYGTTPTDNGITLAWTPEWEAYYFSTGYTEIWHDLPALHNLLPTLIVRGSESDTYIAESSESVKAILPEATHVEVKGGHLFPQSNPDATYQVITDWLANQSL